MFYVKEMFYRLQMISKGNIKIVQWDGSLKNNTREWHKGTVPRMLPSAQEIRTHDSIHWFDFSLIQLFKNNYSKTIIQKL